MKWDMEMERIETVLERIWDLHDKISDAIHEISRAHLLKSIKNITQQSPEKKHLQDGDVNSGSDEKSCGYVFIKGFRADEDAALDETRSLDTIRSALENLEDQIEFFHTVQTQQQVERDAAMARLEQSRAILAMRLSEHQGEKRKVLEQAQALVLDIAEAGHFVAPEHLSSTREDGGPQKGLKPLAFMQALAKRSPGLDWLLGNAALFAVSALVLLQIHQATLKHSGRPRGGCSHTRRHTGEEIMLSAAADYFDVYSARVALQTNHNIAATHGLSTTQTIVTEQCYSSELLLSTSTNYVHITTVDDLWSLDYGATHFVTANVHQG